MAIGSSENSGHGNSPLLDPNNGGNNNPDPNNGGNNNPDPNNGGNNNPDLNDGGNNNHDPNNNPDPNNGGNNNPDPNNGGNNNPDPNTGDCSCDQYSCSDNNTINEYGVGLIDLRLKECSDYYLEKCCGGQNLLPTDNPVTPQPRPHESKCGNRNFDGIGNRITGTDGEAQYGEFPWMVAVVHSVRDSSKEGKTLSVYQCGGSLIHPQVVLTGAHCVHGKDNLVIRAGEWDTQTKDEPYPTQDVKVRNVIIHEQFNNGTLANDPALLILEKPVDMSTENVGLICLPEQNEDMHGRNCVASGWGKDSFGKEGKYHVILKSIDVPIVPRGPCLEALRKTRLGEHFKLHESFICAGGQPGKDTCKGDGGGPLVCPSKNSPNVYVQAGIVAWGIECRTATPGVYVGVPFFINWINNKLHAQGISLN